ncbi:MAG: hypothetical protein KDK39_09825 [Leptospiraceae bacterium]|nr:hypothetical protein [Leptospiraceae bacterium]
MNKKIFSLLLTGMLLSGISLGLSAHSTGNERRTVAQCNGVAHPDRCRACVVGKGKHYHPKLNICHKNLNAKK